jgi:hypothetical protein
MAEERGSTYCEKHTETPTNLRCSRCDKPVCPECMVQAPVGIRCQEHGRPTKLPTYDVSTGFIVRGVAAGVGIGILGGLILGIAGAYTTLFFIPYVFTLAMVGLGYLVGEGISRATNKKRGQPLIVAAVVGVVLAFVIVVAFTGLQLNLFDLIALGIAGLLAVQRVR